LRGSIAASTLSRTALLHHLRVLREAGVLKCEKAGREVYVCPGYGGCTACADGVQDYLAEHH
jgi:DNA-binding transcriptional ArsR family regulator